MEGWKDRQMEGNGWMHGETDENVWVDRWLVELIEGRDHMNRWMDWRMGEWKDGWAHGRE